MSTKCNTQRGYMDNDSSVWASAQRRKCVLIGSRWSYYKQLWLSHVLKNVESLTWNQSFDNNFKKHIGNGTCYNNSHAFLHYFFLYFPLLYISIFQYLWYSIHYAHILQHTDEGRCFCRKMSRWILKLSSFIWNPKRSFQLPAKNASWKMVLSHRVWVHPGQQRPTGIRNHLWKFTTQVVSIKMWGRGRETILNSLEMRDSFFMERVLFLNSSLLISEGKSSVLLLFQNVHQPIPTKCNGSTRKWVTWVFVLWLL